MARGGNDDLKIMHKAFDKCLDPRMLDRVLSKNDVLALVPAWKSVSSRIRNESFARVWCLVINRRTQRVTRSAKADLCSLLGITALFQLASTCLFFSDATKRFVLCPGCKRLPRQFRLPCGHCTCACTAPRCPSCEFRLPDDWGNEDYQSISKLSNQDPRTATSALAERAEIADNLNITDGPPCILLGKTHEQVIDFLQSAITLLENSRAAGHLPQVGIMQVQERPFDVHEEQGSACAASSSTSVLDVSPAPGATPSHLSSQAAGHKAPLTTLEWRYEHTDGGVFATLTNSILGNDVRSIQPAKSKKDAEHLALTDLKHKLESESLKDLQERYQRVFKTSPVWGEVHQSAGPPPKFQTSLIHQGENIISDWQGSKQNAKRSALAKALGGCQDTASAASVSLQVAGSASTSSSTSGSLLAQLQERYQRTFKKTPAWGQIQQSPEQPPKFRASVIHQEQQVAGDWAGSKQDARCSAMANLLVPHGPSLSELQETYQRTFRKSPDWRQVQKSEEIPPRFQASLIHQSEQLVGNWSGNKQDAKRFALAMALWCGQDAPSQDEPSQNLSLEALQETYQRTFKQSPAWATVEVNPEDKQQFKAAFCHEGRIITGSWECGKKSARASALRRLLGS
mmetsp:Transcript_80056/g.158595  ORF Transcript_80056/g.158595 Transcript_80056/m.158595 type:complete len:628 (+) Transcript_80056:62-1945(+)